MRIPKEEREVIKLAALLHGVGKIFISEQVLSKPGNLTDREHLLIRQQPVMEERIVSGVELIKGTKTFIHHHHERFDGKGYPDGLSGEEIPLGAKIISLAEAFDCIISGSAFHPRKGVGEAKDEIKRNASIQFDPQSWGCFRKYK